LANQQGLLIPYALIGSIKVPAGGPTEIAEVVHELEDNAREELRSMAHFGIVMVVTKGSVKVEKVILSIPAEAS
jgi:predicted transcriptional regulator